MSKEDLIDSRTQKTIAQHNWLKDHEFTSAYGNRFKIAGLLGGGLSESYLAAFKLDASGTPIRDRDTGRPRLERLATTPVIEQLNSRGIFAPWDPRGKTALVDNVAAAPLFSDLEEDEEVEEAMLPETSTQAARELAEARLVASIANLGSGSKRSKQHLLLQIEAEAERSDEILP